MGFDQDQVRNYFLDFDVTNIYEIIGMSILIGLNILLLVRLLLNFRGILTWYLQNEDVDPKKLLCINSTLLISVILRLISENYSLWGCVLSDFMNFDLNTPVIYTNIVLYRILEHLYIQTQNLAMLIASRFWLYVIQAKYVFEQQINTNNDQDAAMAATGKHSAYLTRSMNRGSMILVHSSCQYKFLKACSILLRASMLLVIVVSITSCVFLVYNTGEGMIEMNQQMILGTTLISGIAFSASCLVIYIDLDTFYTVDPKYKQRMRQAALFLIFTQIIRFMFNFLQLQAPESLISIKSRGDQYKIPDDGFWWALIVPSYSFVVDFIPTFFLSELFSPLPQNYDQVNPQAPYDDWEVKSIS